MKIIIDTKKMIIHERLSRAERNQSPVEYEKDLLRGLSAAMAGSAINLFNHTETRKGWCDLIARDAKARIINTEASEDGDDH